jgi:hypothetical protein
MNKIEYFSTRLYVTQKMYDELVAYPNYDLIINTSPMKGNHPHGYYKMSNKVARNFIESKQGGYNWDEHQNFKQDSIPNSLRNYFTYS